LAAALLAGLVAGLAAGFALFAVWPLIGALAILAGALPGALAADFAFAAGFAAPETLLPALAGFVAFLDAVFVTFAAFFFVEPGFAFEAALSRRVAPADLATARLLPAARRGAGFAFAADRPAAPLFLLPLFRPLLAAVLLAAVFLVAMDRLSCPIGRSPSFKLPFAPAPAIREPFAAAANGQRPRSVGIAGLQAGAKPRSVDKM
jgi:hypothetical protein